MYHPPQLLLDQGLLHLHGAVRAWPAGADARRLSAVSRWCQSPPLVRWHWLVEAPPVTSLSTQRPQVPLPC